MDDLHGVQVLDGAGDVLDDGAHLELAQTARVLRPADHLATQTRRVQVVNIRLACVLRSLTVKEITKM